MNELADKLTTRPTRFYSLDFFRGFTMFMLVAESTELFSSLMDSQFDGSIVHTIGEQFHHVEWAGLRFWDLIQPFFMFIVGVAIPFSVANRIKAGQSNARLTWHAVKRSLLLLFFGWALYCIGPGQIEFRFQNVLAQLSVTYLIAFLIRNLAVSIQLAIALGMLALTELIYRGFPVEGFNHPFTPNENFGTWLDLQYGGADLGGHWVSFNAIPTTAHTIWGVLAGKLLLSDRPATRKLMILIVAGLLALAIGYGLHPFTPIIKRIATSSFVIVSGGWALLALAFSYGVIDMLNQKKWAWFFSVVGMNSLFIYLFCQIGGTDLIEYCIKPFANALLSRAGELPTQIVSSLLVLFSLWYICYWLYKNKVFVKI